MRAQQLTALNVLDGYARGIFPMAEHQDDHKIHWFDPGHRGVIPIDRFHIPKSLHKFLKKQPFTVTVNKAFPQIITACGETRDISWINPSIKRWMVELHEMGFAHSVECWNPDGTLAGGLYGVALRGAFFGESMVSMTSGASKVALVHLVLRLKSRGYRLLDCQFVNPYLAQFGCIEISRRQYQSGLSSALMVDCSFVSEDDAGVLEDLATGVLSCVSDWGLALGSMQSISHTS